MHGARVSGACLLLSLVGGQDKATRREEGVSEYLSPSRERHRLSSAGIPDVTSLMRLGWGSSDGGERCAETGATGKNE